MVGDDLLAGLRVYMGQIGTFLHLLPPWTTPSAWFKFKFISLRHKDELNLISLKFFIFI